MIEGLVSRILETYLYDYLLNFDKQNLKISLLSGVINLHDLKLNAKIIEDFPFPVTLKYGRIGSISIKLPSLMEIMKPKIKVEISDVFVCLTTKPMSDWNSTEIYDEYQDAKQQSLFQQEQDTKFIFVEHKGDEEKINEYVLSVIQGIQVNIQRIYFRLEDPEYPYALGVLLPSITVENADQNWKEPLKKGHKVKADSIIYKTVQVKDFSIFLERDPPRARIDDLMNLQDIWNDLNFSFLLDQRISEHIRQMFNDEIPTSCIIKKFHIDVRFQMVLDKVRVKEDSEEKDAPDMKIQIMFGGLFHNDENLQLAHFMKLKLKEDQIYGIIQFLNYTGLYNTFRLGVLRNILERSFNPKSSEMQEYIDLYHRYLHYKTKEKQQKAGELKVRMVEIEKGYRTDIIQQLRKVINERYFGLLKATSYRKEQLKNLESMNQRVRSKGLLSRIPFFGKSNDQVVNEVLEEDKDNMSEEKKIKLKQIQFAYGLMKFMYQRRYERGMDELETYSKIQHDPSASIFKDQENYVMEMEFDMPSSSLKIYDKDTDTNQRKKPIFYSVFEGLTMKVRQESKSEYMNLMVSFGNFFIRDFYSPQPSIPFVVQTIFAHDPQCNIVNPFEKQALEFEFEKHPKDTKTASSKLKLYTHGQVYIYANFGFASSNLRLLTRILAVMNDNFAHLIESSPPHIRKAINKGSYYQEMLEKIIAKKQEQFYQGLQDVAYGNYEPPSTLFDINFLSPKIVIHESLLNEPLLDPGFSESMIIDLGVIETVNNLIVREMGFDYSTCKEQEKLYDTTSVKFGKIRIIMDYNLKILNNRPASRELNWIVSKESVALTNEFNFGFELKSCLTPFHKVFPAQVINVKVQELQLNISRKITQSIFKLQNLIMSGKFMKTFNLFIQAPPPRAPEDIDQDENQEINEESGIFEKSLENENEEDKRMEEENKQVDRAKAREKEKAEEIKNETLLQYIKRTTIDVAIEEIKEEYHSQKYDDAKKAISIELNFIFQELKICIVDLENIYVKIPSPSSIQSSFVQEGHQILSLNLGKHQIKARFEFIPKTKLKMDFFLKRIYIEDKDRHSEACHKFLILNPFIDLEEDEILLQSPDFLRQKYSSNTTLQQKRSVTLQNVPVSRKSQRYFGEASFKTKEFARNNVLNKDLKITFDEFNHFSPAKEILSQNNQFVVTYGEVGNNQELTISLSNLRLVFIVPLTNYLLRFYADFMIDMYDIQRIVENHLAGKNKNPQRKKSNVFTFRQNTMVSNVFGDKTQNIEKKTQASNKEESGQKLQKTFTIHKKYTKEKEVDEEEKEQKGSKMFSAMFLAKHTTKMDKEKKREEVKAIDQELRYERRTVFLKMTIESSTFELLVPTNIYSRNALELKIQGKVSGKSKTRTDYDDAYYLDKWNTLKGSTIRSNAQDMDLKLHQLAIYVDNPEDANSDSNSEFHEKIYFLHPYDLDLHIRQCLSSLNEKAGQNKFHIHYDGKETIQLSIGLKELNSYLILGQLYFKFQNDMNDVLQEIVDAQEKDLQERQNMKTQKQNDRKSSKKEAKKTSSLNEILKNERLLKDQEARIKNMWKKGVRKAVASISKKDFFEFVSIFNFKGLQFHFVDNVSIQKLALLTFSLTDFTWQLENRGFEALNLYKMENIFQIEGIDKEDSMAYLYSQMIFYFEGSYYNKNNYASEPFIEKFPFVMLQRQQTPLSVINVRYESEEMLNINFSYGLACNLQRVIQSLMSLEQEQNLMNLVNKSLSEKEMEEQNQLKIPIVNNGFNKISMISTDMIKLEYKKQKLQKYLTEQQQVQNPMNKNFMDSDRFLDVAEEFAGEVEETFETADSLMSEVTDIEFINNSGMELKFCLSIFSDSLKSLKKVQVIGENQILQTDKVHTLSNSKKLIISMTEFESQLEKFNSITYDKSKSSIKINFVIDGYRVIENVVLQRNGIFGYWLYHEGKRKRDIFMGEKTEQSCIVRINRDGQFVQVFFESNLVLFNDSKFNLWLLHKEKDQEKKETFIKDQKVINAPLTWLLNHGQLLINKNTKENPQEELIFDNMKHVFDPRIIKPYQNFAKVVRVLDKYISVDIFYLKTKTSVGQFLVVFQPVLTIANFLFTEMILMSVDKPQPKIYGEIKTNTMQSFYEINPYMENKCPFRIAYKADEHEIYQRETHFNLKEIKRHAATGLHKGFFINLINEDRKDQDMPALVQIAFEKQKQTTGLKETKYDNFFLRKVIYQRTKGMFFKAYAPYIAINQTNVCLKLQGLQYPLTLNPYTSIFFIPQSTRMKVKADGFKESKSFQINTFGVSGSIKLLKLGKLKKQIDDFEVNMLDPALDPCQKQMEIGTYIGICPQPYSRTKVIKFLPRYVIVNKLDLPIVIKERHAGHQIPLAQGEEIYFNLSNEDQDMLMVRLLNLKDEAKIIERKQQNAESKQNTQVRRHIIEEETKMRDIMLDINNLPSPEPDKDIINNSSFLKSIADDHDQVISRREASMADENYEEDHDQFELNINKVYGTTTDRGIWSYKFPIGSIDDFQVSLPNINKLPDKDYGWTINEKKFFVRVNISPSPDNDATLFITFTQPSNIYVRLNQLYSLS